MPRTKRCVARKRQGWKTFVTYLRFHRLRLGLTQHQVAKRAKISQGAYCSYEKGWKKPHPEAHKRLADALERPLDEFTGKLYGVDPATMVTQTSEARA